MSRLLSRRSPTAGPDTTPIGSARSPTVTGAGATGTVGVSAAAAGATGFGTGLPGAVAALRAGAAPVAGLGTGFTTRACQKYSTRKHRKIAKRTRRSMPTWWDRRSGLRQARDHGRPRTTDGTALGGGGQAIRRA